MQQPQKQPEGHLSRPWGCDFEGGWTPARPEPSNDGKKWKGDWIKKWVIIFRASVLLFSLLTFILVVTVSGFHYSGRLSYLLSIAIITMVYSTVQVWIKGHELRKSKDVISPKVAIWIDFCGDQFLAYMLLSSATAGATLLVSLSNLAGDITEVQLIAASVCMSVLAFISLAPAALFSAYRLFANI